MLSRLLGRRGRAGAPPRSVPPGTRVYAIGDIHGRGDLLDDLIAQIDADDAARAPAATTIVVLGDLVDRGPDSAGVVGRMRALAQDRRNLRFLKGNHEEIFLAALDADAKALRLFCRVGGRETALSYGIPPEMYERSSYEDLAALLAIHVPSGDRAFMAGFEDMIVVGDYAFVHAGVDPRVPLDEQKPADLRWIRNRFLDHDAPLEKMIVHGHTIAEAVEYRAHRIGIDTGAYESGTLTALGLEGDTSWILSTKRD